jgi:hypothetical protein
MKVAFYKGNKEIFNNLVRWWTRGPYSHVELVMPDGQSFSSSYRDGGVRGKYIQFDDGHWDFLELDASLDEKIIMERINGLMGMKYDTRGIFGFVIRSIGDNRHKMFCSEFLMHVLGYYDAWRFDPNTAFAVLLKNGR